LQAPPPQHSSWQPDDDDYYNEGGGAYDDSNQDAALHPGSRQESASREAAQSMKQEPDHDIFYAEEAEQLVIILPSF
jgi:hypothetical protein